MIDFYEEEIKNWFSLCFEVNFTEKYLLNYTFFDGLNALMSCCFCVVVVDVDVVILPVDIICYIVICLRQDNPTLRFLF